MPVVGSGGDIRSRVIEAVDRTFSETIRLSFFARQDVDSTRPATEIRAVLRVGGGDERNLGGGFAQEWRARVAAGKAELHIDRNAYPDLIVRSDDRVCAVDRPGQPWFQVLRIDDRGDTRLVLALGEI